MTRKDFVLIADAIKTANERAEGDGPKLGVKMAAHALSWVLTDSNPFFDRARFLAACGLED